MAQINKIKVGTTVYDVGGGASNYAEITLGTSWSGTAPALQQIVTGVTGLTGDDHPILDVVITSGSTVDDEAEAWSKIWKAESGAAQLTFYATEATATAITVAVKW